MRESLTMTGKIIVFSGLDGSGKSTQIKLLCNWLEHRRVISRYLWTRGGYTSGVEALKKIMRHLSRGKMLPASGPSEKRERAFEKRWVRRFWLTLALLDLIRIYGVVIRWWKWRGNIVICDRYLWDTSIDFHLNFPLEQHQDWFLWRFLEKITPQPDLSFLMLVPVKESLLRSDKKSEPFRDTPDVLEQRLTAYKKMIVGGHWIVMDGCREIDDLAGEIIKLLKNRIYAN